MILFDGHDLTALAVCGDPELTLFQYMPNLKDTSGNGSIFAGSRIAAGTVSVTAAVVGAPKVRRDKLTQLAQWLNVDEPKKLYLPDSPEWFYYAVPSAGFSLERHIDGEVFTLEFTLTDPVAYGREVSFTVPSGGSITFTVRGTAAARPVITASAAKAQASTLLWSLRIDEGDYLRLSMGSTVAKAVTVDCNSRTARIAGAVAIPTLDSDWLEFEPGEHTIRNDLGTGAATVVYRERWL